MAFPVIPEEYLGQFQVEKPAKRIVQTISAGVSSLSKKTSGLGEFIILFTITFWYFFFTGLAILFGRKLPNQWLRIAKDLNKGRVASKIKPEKPVEPTKFKVVDLETERPLKTVLVNPTDTKTSPLG